MSMRWLRFISTCVMLLFPWIARAEESTTMSFAPPSTDISVTYLGNIFGVVDGVLHGTGSQMMGTMLGVFNAAVLALGGIVIMYIILVSTMNTAHEGQMLGQKWSSIWVPIRATIGLALLIPKSSGYCLMQIFVMWVVLQGIGVADKIWGAALDYMNRGGVIIKADMAPSTSLYAGGGSVADGGATILYGQVCMAGLQAQLEKQRDAYLNAKEQKSGPCYNPTSGSDMDKFCNDAVPDFINSVSPIAAYNDQYTENRTAPYSVKMPNFSDSSIYQTLNGICGVIQWNAMNSDGSMDTVEQNITTLSESDMETVEASRAAAVEQMYLTLSTTARQMVDNDPQLNGSGAATDDASIVADDQFGIAFTSSLTACAKSSDDCPSWQGDDDFSDAPVLLDGTELQDAIADYNAVMSPALKLIEDANNSSEANQERAFISEAKERGWITAGSYFYDLANLNGSAKASTTTDTQSGLGDSTFSTDTMLEAFSGSNCNTSSIYVDLCYIFNKNTTYVQQVVDLITGSSVVEGGVSPVTVFDETQITPVKGAGSSTVYGYVHNAMLIDLPEQEGTTGPKISMEIPSPDFASLSFPKPDTSDTGCGKISLLAGWTCFAGKITSSLINEIINPFIDAMVAFTKNAGIALYKAFVVYPMLGITYIFVTGVEIIGEEGVNPVIGIAKMGATFINFAMDSWMIALGVGVLGLLPFDIGSAIAAFIGLCMPFFLMWMSVMLGMGFVMTYFVPFYPYMIFTLGALAWLVAVIESMVAAPVVALGIAHPEGHDALGKSEQGLMILLNVFLRPGMMIIGYIGAIALSFVGIWIMNAGIGHVIEYLQSTEMWGANSTSPITSFAWTAFFGIFFAALFYTALYMLIAMKAFTLIAVLPDKVLRWIGGAPEGVGQETMQWAEETKGKIDEGGKKTATGQGQFGKQAYGVGATGVEKLTGKKVGGPGPEIEASGKNK